MTLRGHKGGVTALALASDGRTLFSVADDGAVKAWNIELGTVSHARI
jgi:hypothetical protein